MFKGEAVDEQDDLVVVSWRDVQISAGDGAVVQTERELGKWPFARDWYRKHIGYPEDQCQVVNVRGDSMEPTFRSGDPVLVYLAPGQLPVDGIWVVRLADLVTIKRVQFLPGRVARIISDNARYDPYSIDLNVDQPDFNFVGKVIWSQVLH